MQKPSIAIIIPSFNESSNLKILLKKIYKNIPDATIIIVDDSNPEENRKIQKQIKKNTLNKIKLITRNKKLGRGSAVIDGFNYALKNTNVKYFIEMDSDLSHDPNEFHLFTDKMNKSKWDLIIGSRYKDKSKIIDWPLKRIITSKIINTFLDLLFGLNLTDYTNGFRLYSREAIIYLTSIKLKATGFTLLSETAYRLKQKGFNIAEVPITFSERKYGKSSVTSSQLFSSLISVLRVRISN